MVLMHPWLAPVGAVAVGLPILIHWLTRPRPVHVPISTLRFIEEALQQRRALHRLRDALILSLRCAAVLLLAAAFIRPLLGQRPASEAAPGGVRIVVLDVSQSLAAARHGIQAIEQARPVAANYLSFSPGLRANLILAGARPHPVFEAPSSNFGSLRDALAKAQPRPERLDVGATLTAAAQMLASGAGELVIVSDFQRSNWSEADFSVLPQGTRVRLESVAPAEALPNLAVLGVTGGHAVRGEDVRLQVEVGNYSPTPQKVQVELTLGGAAAHAEALCPADGRASVPVTVRPEGGGWQSGQVSLRGVDDGLGADNTRPFVLEVRPAATYALITRQPTSRVGSSSYYLERALVPGSGRGDSSGEKVRRIEPTELDPQTLAGADLLLLDHPGRLPAQVINVLAAQMRRGQSILYVAAEPSDATNLKLLTQACSASLKMPVEFLPASDGSRRDLSIRDVRRESCVFNVFGDRAASVIQPVRLGGGLDSRALAAGLADDVWARCSDGSALLVVCACGAGRLAVLNADLSFCNLPSSALFVPLVNELGAYLLGERRLAAPVACGEAIRVLLPAEAGPAAGLTLSPPAGTEDGAALNEDEGGVWLRCGGVGGPGVYEVRRGDSPCFGLASAIPSVESDLGTMSPEALQAKAGPAAQYHSATGSGGENGDDLWVWLALGAVLCALGELALLKVFRT
jgi:hypothetical protein